MVARTHASHTLFFYEHEFDSRRRYKKQANTGKDIKCVPVGASKTTISLRRFRLVARTHASHAWNTGSIPVGATNLNKVITLFFLYFVAKCNLLIFNDFF